MEGQRALGVHKKYLNLCYVYFLLLSKSLELMELQTSREALQQDLHDQHSAHQRTVEELRRQNSESLGKLRETAEQFEWLCEQQRSWMSCVKRFINASVAKSAVFPWNWATLKCPYYAFSNITFHAVFHVAVYEHKLSAKPIVHDK